MNIFSCCYNYIDYDDTIKQMEKEFLGNDLFLKTNMFVADGVISSIIEDMIYIQF